MAMSIRKGDWIWYFNGEIEPGAIVVLHDPLNPEQKILRRVIAIEGQTLAYDKDGVFHIDDQRIIQSDMGIFEDESTTTGKVIEEHFPSSAGVNTFSWRTIRKKESVLWELENTIAIPKDHFFLAADRRDEAIDSRWWGPIHKKNILGIVRLRIGHSDPWRSSYEILPH